MGNWVDPRNPKGRRRKTTYVGEGKDFEVKKGQSLKDEGYPHSTSPSSQPTGKAQPATRNYIREAFQQAGINSVDDLSKAKGTNEQGQYRLDRWQGKAKWSKEMEMAKRRTASQIAGKGNWTKEGAMAERKAAAKANGKGNWNAQDEMKKRREAAQAQGKGNWNAQDEMRKRREAAMAKKKGK